MLTDINKPSLAQQGRDVIHKEIDALRAMSDRIGDSFVEVVQVILDCPGRVVLTGMGKHGLVARKIAATLASTGTPAFYMHPGEALHGDLGMIQAHDIVLALSNSGTTEEVISCIPFFKRNGNTLVAMTGNLSSRLATEADIVLDIQVEREVCPLNLAPTTSTTAALAMGDALAVVLLEQRGFQAGDFALRHPNGALGRQFKRVGDLMKQDSNPTVPKTASFREAVAAITKEKHGAVSVVDDNGCLCGILTDGDLRRILQRESESSDRTVSDVFHQPVSSVMTRSPLRITADVLATQALNVMENGNRKVLVLPVVDQNDCPIGMIHLHDLIG